MTIEVCQFLPWDTAFFGRRIARINGHQLDEQRLRQILAWCSARQIECLYFLAEAHDPHTVRLAEEHRFRFVDIRLTLQAQLGKQTAQAEPPASGMTVRLCQAADLPALRQIARSAYTDSRYYADDCFTEEQRSAFYETWITKSCEGYADAVLVAEEARQVLGYVSCSLTPGKPSGQIGLVGVASDAQGRGVGRLLLDAALRWFGEHGAQEVVVVTQGRNVPAQRLYQRSGFVTMSVQLWYHKWFIEC